MSEAAFITTALEEIKGYGIISVGQDINVDVDFVLRILRNGKGIGTISLKAFRQDTFDHFKQSYFSLNGRGSVTGYKLIAGDCRMANFTEIDGKFTFQSLEILPDSLDTKPQKELYLHASVLNMYQTHNVVVETSIGQLLVGHYKEIARSENIMRIYDIPLVTSFLQISILPDGYELISDILSKGIETTEAFLKITSLYQMVWHTWVTFGIYEKDTEKLLLFKFSIPREKIPVSSPLGDRYYANEFINAAWKGYSNNHEMKYNFDSALEWFIESNSSALLETQYLCATTCLEMLMDNFHTQNETEFLLNEVTYGELYNVIKYAAKTFLISKGIDSNLRRSVYGALKGCNRRA